ncbi:hypothetical protein QNI16_30750 [Cytophagaceae bacterium YF14B1]|uniref:Uncharacterized protein n=1 Tax=Xanthocytophaga flava TaxID=3048013 RepID=A0AAE3U9B8_9BACT|nr:hypothetical protein [Xanthocytophaga flavus]MDJ1484919.1 hypothetical protein [Xanthocytophaga flavus]
MQNYEFSVKDMKDLIADASDDDFVMISVQFTRDPNLPRKEFLAKVIATVSSSSGLAKDGGGGILGCPTPPGCG